MKKNNFSENTCSSTFIACFEHNAACCQKLSVHVRAYAVRCGLKKLIIGKILLQIIVITNYPLAFSPNATWIVSRDHYSISVWKRSLDAR